MKKPYKYVENIKNNPKKIYYFIGIGGVGMSSLAFFLLNKGHTVYGSDLEQSVFTKNLIESGAKIFLKHCKSNIPQNVDYCIVNSAIDQTNEELEEFKQRGTKILTRGELLGLALNGFKNSIAVAGCHGKTTTTAFLYQTLLSCGKVSDLFLGGLYKNNNYYVGDGEIAVAEACEYKSSFLALSPQISVILNVDHDHVDCFKTLDDVRQAFCKFAQNTQKDGVVITEKSVADFLGNKNINAKILSFAINGNKNDCDYFADNLKSVNGRFEFDLYERGLFVGRVRLNAVGEHLVLSALATYAVARFLGVEARSIIEKLKHFTGVERRWQKFESNFTNVIADYAHHPTEIKNLIQTSSYMGYKKIYVLFQPHTYSRTKGLLSEFATCFCGAEKVVVLPVFSARENPVAGGDSTDLVKSVSQYTPCVFAKNFDDAKILLSQASINDLLLVVGAGDVIKFCRPQYLNIEKE